MIMPRIVVTGATGKTGSVVSAELLQAGYPVRAMVHREDGRSARLKALGAEIVVAEMSDVERVIEALDGVQRAYYCPPIDPYATFQTHLDFSAGQEHDQRWNYKCGRDDLQLIHVLVDHGAQFEFTLSQELLHWATNYNLGVVTMRGLRRRRRNKSVRYG